MTISIEEMAVFCKKKGFVYPNSEIYGGLAGFWDFGPLGVELKNNLKQQWWKTHVQERDDIVGIDGSIITHPKVWEASGHVSCFTDVMLECTKCGNKVRGDQFIEEKLKTQADGLSQEEIDKLVENNNLRCPKCNSEFKKAQPINLMFKTHIGPSGSQVSYLRPETAQLMFADFKFVQNNARAKLPFGIAQMGRSFRNEISPRDFLFRSREFEQMEIEYFVNPEEINKCPYLKEVLNHKIFIISANMQKDKKKEKKLSIKEALDKKIIKTNWHAYWLAFEHKWFVSLGANPDNFRIRQHLDSEKSHYALDTWDLEYNFPFGWKELQGLANRTDFDLKQHSKYSKTDLSYFDEDSKKKIIPHVVAEPSQGVERALLVFLFDAYNDDKKRGNIVLKLHPKLAPIKVAIFPLVNKLNKEARAVYDQLKKEFCCFYDSSGSVGRRYARQDEIGTPLCITVDFEVKKNNTVTLRNRDTTKQIRVKTKDLIPAINSFFQGEKLDKLGKVIN